MSRVELYDLSVVASAREPRVIEAAKVDVRPQGTFVISAEHLAATFYDRDDWQVVIR